MSDDNSTGKNGQAQVHVEGVGPEKSASGSKQNSGTGLLKASSTTQLPERRIRSLGIGIKPPYNPDRLASFLELNETHATSIRKKSRWEVGFGFDIVPVDDVDADEASQDELDTAEAFWRGRDSRWQTGPKNSAEQTTPEEVFELARQDYHGIGWLALEILTNAAGEPVGLAHVPANTIRVRKPAADPSAIDEDDDRAVAHEAAKNYGGRGYVQVRNGRRRFFGEAGDRYRGRGDDDDRDPIFVGRETGDVVVGSAEKLDDKPANELIFIRNPSPLEQDYGIPDWVSAIRTISGDEAAKDYNIEFFQNDTIPRFVIKVTNGELTEESRRDLKQMLDGLREESHRAVVLEVEKFSSQIDADIEIELEPLGQGISEEMDFREYRAKNEHDIAKVHEVPPILVGVTETSNRSNSQEQVHDFATNVIAPEQHKFSERLYRVLHQTALGIEDWTLEFELRGADQPKEDADIARRKIQAVRGAIPINRALAMIGEDPLPEDHPVDGQTLVADVGSDTQPVGAPQSDAVDVKRAAAAPPTSNKVATRDWESVKADLEKDPIEKTSFDSTNLDEGLYDFGTQELFLSFKRDGGPNSLYAYVDVPPSTWSGLVNASSAGSYHYDNIRLDYAYVEVTNFHSRLPEGPEPDSEEIPEGVPSSL